jgi:hypothetical protein
VQLPLYPLLKSKLIKGEDIIIDSKSGQHSPAQQVAWLLWGGMVAFVCMFGVC